MLQKLFCWLYSQWLAKFVDEKTDLLVVWLDFLVGSGCKYCMAVRAAMMGFGAGLLAAEHWGLGLGIGLPAFLFTLGERYWLCEVKSK